MEIYLILQSHLADAVASDLEGEFLKMNALKGSIVIAAAALVMVMAPAMALDESGNFTIDDVSNFFHTMQSTDLGDIEISADNITLKTDARNTNT